MKPRGALLAAVAWALLPACSSEEPATTSRRGIPTPDDRGPVLMGSPKPSAPEPEPENAPSLLDDDDWDDWDDESESEPAPAAAAKAPPTDDAQDDADEDAPKRDVGRELVALLDLGSCLDGSKQNAPQGPVTLRAEAFVLSSGRIQGASVRMPGQPASALDCLAKQLESQHLPDPVEGAPNRFSGSVQVDYTPPPTSTEE